MLIVCGCVVIAMQPHYNRQVFKGVGQELIYETKEMENCIKYTSYSVLY